MACEVSKCAPLVAHRCHLPPGDRGLPAEQLGRDVLDGLADLDEAHPNGVETSRR
jgi:hypothetical protein